MIPCVRSVRPLFLLVATLLAASPVFARTGDEMAAAGDVLLRARTEPAQVYVGQPIALEVDVLTRTWFLRAPRYPDVLDIPDAIVIPPEVFGVNFSESIEGATFAGQTRTFVVFPTRPGPIEVPSFPVTLVVADDDARPTPEFTLRTPALRFEAELPAAARGLGLVVAAPRVDVAEAWDPPLTGLRAGDSVRRTITMSIEGSIAMLLPEIEFRPPAGVAAYRDRSTFEDVRERGRMAGTRVESATFVFERSGTFTLPEIVVPWWDLEAKTLRKETLPAVDVTVTDNPDAALPVFAPPDEDGTDSPPPAPRRRPSWRIALAALLVIVAAGAFRRMARSRRKRAARARAPATPTEAELFARFERTAREGNPRRTLAACYTWFDVWRTADDPFTLAQLVARTGDTALAGDLRGLGAAAVGAEGEGSAERLVRGLSRIRRRRARRKRAGRDESLGSLNPAPSAAAGDTIAPGAGGRRVLAAIWLGAALGFGGAGCDSAPRTPPATGEPAVTGAAPGPAATSPAPAPAPPAEPRAVPGAAMRAKLVGWWLRHDQSYMMILDAVAEDGRVDARYLNPEPVHVSRAEMWLEGDSLRLLLELTDRNYPGNYYELAYQPDPEMWIGLYHHLGNGQTYEVYFVRFEDEED